jgi:pimeloyl-ACP methyl ester carboxylesterase
MTTRTVVYSIAGAMGATIVLLSVLCLVGDHWIRAAEPESGEHLPAGIAGRVIMAGGHRVHIVEQGEGTPVLLVHGTAGSTFDWEAHALAPLARHHRVIAVDLLGMGFSERSDAFRYGFDLWTAQLAATLDVLGIPRAAVVGHSLGGAIAAVFAADYPERVERVVSVDSGPWMPWFLWLMMTPGAGEVMLGRVAYWPDLSDAESAYVNRMQQIYRIHGTRRTLLRYARGIVSDSAHYFGAYPRIAAPTLLLHGGADPIIPRRAAASLQRLIPHSRLVVIDGAGHFLMNDAPQQFVEEVEKFLDGD